uniref:EF-hand domain-containing protein n=1 Tax=Haptolina brevifila TaxID=156173 RepID=A0A7S2IEZ2_9EUKA|mmetsp:Transcript_65510/g.129755  ORF Transcript_65510/g.129755 Transcript_65510/m.129755 type:complete len:107 (+) Transcript_65510:283-603(+)
MATTCAALAAFIKSFLTTPLEPVFRGWDRDKDGSLDRSEFRRAVRSTGLVASCRDADHIFDEWDVDHSGSIDLAEMGRVLDALKRGEIKRSQAEETNGKHGRGGKH